MRIVALAVALAAAVTALLIVWDRGDEAWRDCAGELASGAATVEQVSPPAEVAAQAVLELENTAGVAFHPAASPDSDHIGTGAYPGPLVLVS